MFNPSQTYNLDEAQEYCQGAENATLIEIYTQEQLDFFKMARFAIEGQDRRKSWWLGGTDRGREGDWFWMNSLKPVGDFVWWQTQPSGGLDENCMYCTVDAGISFWDIPCDEEHYPVCQRLHPDGPSDPCANFCADKPAAFFAQECCATTDICL